MRLLHLGEQTTTFYPLRKSRQSSNSKYNPAQPLHIAMAPLPHPDTSFSLSHLAIRALSTPFDSESISSILKLKRHPLAQLSHLATRQSSSALIPENYTNRNTGPSPGTVVGIVLGSVGGFLLILWLLYSCFGGGSIWPSNESEGSIVIRERKRSHRSHSTRSRRVSEARSVPVERVIVTEERRTRTRAPPVVESSIGSSDADEVVVIEEHSPPRRSKSKRESGYRTVDPLAYGGGDRPLRKVSAGSRR